MSKKLESRNNLLSCWVEKGATLKGYSIHQIWRDEMIEDEWYLWNVILDDEGCSFDIFTLLYSPESNFFSTMFPIKNPLLVDSQSLYSDKERSSYSAKAKAICVMSPDPLVRLLNNLNETTSS